MLHLQNNDSLKVCKHRGLARNYDVAPQTIRDGQKFIKINLILKVITTSILSLT